VWSLPGGLLRGYRDSLLETAQEAVTIACTRVHRWAQEMWQKIHSLSVCISSRIGHIWAPSQLSLCTHNPAHSLYNYFSISEQFFPRMAPRFFGYTIHQVIWPSPSTLFTSLPTGGGVRVPGLGKITWWIVMTRKIRGIRGKKLLRNREIIVEWTVGVVGAHGQLTQGAILRNPRTKYKRSKNVIAITTIALNIGRDWPRLLQPLAQFLIGSPITLGGV